MRGKRLEGWQVRGFEAHCAGVRSRLRRRWGKGNSEESGEDRLPDGLAIRCIKVETGPGHLGEERKTLRNGLLTALADRCSLLTAVRLWSLKPTATPQGKERRRREMGVIRVRPILERKKVGNRGTGLAHAVFGSLQNISVRVFIPASDQLRVETGSGHLVCVGSCQRASVPSSAEGPLRRVGCRGRRGRRPFPATDL